MRIVSNTGPIIGLEGEPGDVVEFFHLLSVRFLSLSAETLNRLGHG